MSQSLFQWKLLCNLKELEKAFNGAKVTILILVETSLQLKKEQLPTLLQKSHNPYFSGNFFAIPYGCCYSVADNRSQSLFQWKLLCNGSAAYVQKIFEIVTILILVETSLQCKRCFRIVRNWSVTILILVETSLQ